MTTSWKTTVFGLLGALAVIITQNPEIVHYQPTALVLARLICAGAFAGLGIVARDGKVTDEQAGARKP